MFGLGEVRAVYIIMDGVNAREERKTIVLTGVKVVKVRSRLVIPVLLFSREIVRMVGRCEHLLKTSY